MNYELMELGHGQTIEVCEHGQLMGYVIWFSGGWDAWKVLHPAHRVMEKVAINVATSEEAIKAITG